MFKKYIALSMRETNEARYTEPRDAIARDWYGYLGEIFPNLGIFLIPNDTAKVADYLRSLPLAGVILSGGNDIGEAPTRDQTEYILIETAMQLKLPTIGICRGAQVIQRSLGGKIEQLNHSDSHVATEHAVEVSRDPLDEDQKSNHMRVNSYHSQGILMSQLAMQLYPFAISHDQTQITVEGFVNREHRLLGMMWHPERPSPNHDWNQKIFQKWLSP